MQTTSQTWKTLWAAGNAAVEARATINSVVYTDIAPQITRAAMQQGLSVGNVVSACCSVAIRTTNAIPRSASVAVEMRLSDGTTTSEWLPAGAFYISRRSRDPISGILSLECYDSLLKANANMPAQSTGYWPRAMASLASDIATAMGVSIDSRSTIATGAIYVVDEPAQGTTMRDLLGVIGAANGGNWIITPGGKLRLVPIIDAADAASATDDAQDITAVLGSVYTGDATTISGVRYTSGDALPVLIGSDTGVILDVSMTAALAQGVATQLTGQTVQPYALAKAVYDPAAEIGDYIRYGTLAGVLYSESVTLGAAARGDLSAPDPAELADEYPYPGASDKALTQAKAYTVETVAALNDGLDQEGVFNRLTNNGADQGVILYDGKIYINATYINTGELNAALVRIKNLSADDISSGIIHSADYAYVQVSFVYPASDIYPASDLYPSNGEYVTSGFAIDFETGQIYGGFYSGQISALQDRVTALENALVYPKSVPSRTLQMAMAMHEEPQEEPEHNEMEDER